MPLEGPFVVGGVHRLRCTLTKNGGDTFNLTGYTVVYTFVPPDGGTPFRESAVIETAATGITYFDTEVGASGTFSVEGVWVIQPAVITSGGAVTPAEPIGVYVLPSYYLAAA